MTEAYMLYRKGDPETSREAAESIDVAGLEKLVYQQIHASGPNGTNSDAVRAVLSHLPYSSVTARFSALKRKGLVYDTGRRVKGVAGRNQAVLAASVFQPREETAA